MLCDLTKVTKKGMLSNIACVFNQLLSLDPKVKKGKDFLIQIVVTTNLFGWDTT